MRASFLIIAAIALGCAAPPTPPSEEPAIQASAILFMRTQRADETSIVRTASVIPSSLLAATNEELAFFVPDAAPETLDSFRARAAISVRLVDDAFPPGSVISTLPDPAPQENAAVVGVSRVGLGVDEAVIFVDVRCGDGCAETHVLFLRYEEERWTVVASKRTSVA